MNQSIIKGTLAFALATMISRITGLLRDAFFAGYFGTSSQYDAYLVAILIPFFLRKIFAEGALSMVFVPLFAEKKKKSLVEAFKFASTILILVVSITGAISLIGIFFSEPISVTFAGGFEPEVIELTAKLMKITFPFVLLVSTWSVFYGILNSLNFYFIAALSPAFINISTITGIVLSRYLNPPILGPTIGFIIGGVAQLTVLIIASSKRGFRFTLTFDKESAREFSLMFLIAMISPAITQLNSLVDTRVATELGSGAVSSLQYAMRLYQLPLGMFAVAVATVSLAELSKFAGDKEREDFKKILWEAFGTLMFLVIPATIGLMILSKEIVALLFQRGKFTFEDTLNTSRILRAYAVGMPFYGIFGIFSRAHYARKNPRFPSIVAMIMAGTNILLDIILGLTIGPVGIAWATTIAGILGAMIVSFGIFKKIGYESGYIRETLKIAICTSGMVLVLVLLKALLPFSTLSSLIEIVAGTAIFMLLAKLLKVKELEGFMRFLIGRKTRG
ncbi:murein biosynthesis integral membrane protein MurJ [Kosmotoga sp. DU53]|nr:murein biosynthesis integral membrane protein MurJ [Kosmotoga sp. DU53]MDK2953465.1 putative peptidoglycan lipid flippase [Kosmotoga sp.]OAA19138.1 membrane protein [Kosmotoga sp. DU53]